MQVIRVAIILSILVVISACGNQELIPSEYVSWVNDETNHLLKRKTVHPLIIEALYKPIPYIIANEKRTNDISKEEYDARKKELEGMQYYTLKLSTIEGDITSYGVTDKAQQDERYNYLSFAMKNDIVLQIGEEILPCKLFHFERSYDLVDYRSFVLAFEVKEAHKNKDKTLILDIPYFQTGPIKLNYKTSDLDEIPSLKL
jgi:hypothetical protein